MTAKIYGIDPEPTVRKRYIKPAPDLKMRKSVSTAKLDHKKEKGTKPEKEMQKKQKKCIDIDDVPCGMWCIFF